MYLLDTNILSLIGPRRVHTPEEAAVRNWIEDNSDRLFLSVISISEVELGAARQGASKKAGDLASWLNSIVHLYASRILTLDLNAARLTGRLLDKADGIGGDPGYEDAAIAATAMTQDLTVLTRNTRHFKTMEVPCLNPYEGLPTT
jgi:predicted nucleic acid-binding protein